MVKADILTILKSDLDIASTSTSKDAQLNNLIDFSVSALTRQGITFSNPYTTEEGTLIEMMAAFLYRRRKDADAKEPDNFRFLRNNILLSQKAATDEQ